MHFHPHLTANGIECTRTQSLQAATNIENLSKEYENILGSFGKLIQNYNERYCSQYKKLSEKTEKLSLFCSSVSEWSNEIISEANSLQMPYGVTSSLIQSTHVFFLRIFSPKKIEEIQKRRNDTAEVGIKLNKLAQKISTILFTISKLSKNNIEHALETKADQCRLYWSCCKIENLLIELQSQINTKSLEKCPGVLLDQLKAMLPQNQQFSPSLTLIQNISVIQFNLLPGVTTKLPEDPLWNHNMSMLFSHCGSNLYVDQEGRLQITNRIVQIRPSTGNVALDFGFAFVSSIVNSSLNDPKSITLLNSSELAVLDCATATIQKATKYIKEFNSHTICLIDPHPYVNCIPENIKRILETLFLYGFTPYSFPAISKIKNLDVQQLDLPVSLKKLLLTLQKHVSRIPDPETSLSLIEYWCQKLPKNFIQDPKTMDRKEWQIFSKHINKSIQVETDNDLLSIIIELDILLDPWRKAMIWTDIAVDSISIRSFMPNPACREITTDKFLSEFSNLFSWVGGVRMSKISPVLYDAYKELYEVELSRHP